MAPLKNSVVEEPAPIVKILLYVVPKLYPVIVSTRDPFTNIFDTHPEFTMAVVIIHCHTGIL